MFQSSSPHCVLKAQCQAGSIIQSLDPSSKLPILKKESHTCDPIIQTLNPSSRLSILKEETQTCDPIIQTLNPSLKLSTLKNGPPTWKASSCCMHCASSPLT